MPEPGPGLGEGPVLVTVEYRIDPAKETEFRMAARRLKRGRLRSGARRWSLYSDMADPGRFIESFLVETWLEHLRQHERVTVNDRGIEEEVRAFHEGSDPPKVNHFLARPLPRG
jgi:quinol monooxygenase YgiN